MRAINYIILVLMIFLNANCLIPENYPNIDNHKSFNPDSLLERKNSVEIIIEPEFDTYLVNQDIWIKVDVINNSDSNYYSKLSLFTGGSLLFSIIDPDSLHLHLNLTINFALQDTAFILRPGERIQEIESLNLYFFGQSGTKTGTYWILCSLFDGHHEIPVIKSNTIEIDVIEPVGSDKKLYYLTRGLSMYPTNVEETLYLKNLINKYPKSVYILQLYNTSIFTAMNNKCEEIFESSCDEYFKSYLDFFESKHILETYFHNLIYFQKLSNKEMDKIFNNLRNRNKTEKSKIVFDSFSRRYIYLRDIKGKNRFKY